MMYATVRLCNSVTAELGNPGDISWTSVIVDFMQKAIEAVDKLNPKEFLKWTVTTLLGEAGKLTEGKPAEAGKAGEVIDGYIAARAQLVTKDPLPPIIDIDGPNFRYEHFHYGHDDPGRLAPEVERERQKHIKEHPDPHGLIHDRLSGIQ